MSEILKQVQNDKGRLVETKEAARVLNVTPRVIQKWFAAGKIEGEFVDSGKGYGKGGLVLMVWIGQDNRIEPNPHPDPLPEGEGEKQNIKPRAVVLWGTSLSAPEPSVGTRKVFPGEPGGEVVTEIMGGEPCTSGTVSTPSPPDPPLEREECDNLPQPLLAKEGSNLPQVVPPVTAIKTISEKALKEANLKYALIRAFQEELKKNHRPKKEIVDHFLSVYNAGISHPAIYNDIGAVARSTLYFWMQCYETGGIDGLAPNYSNQSAIKKVTPAEQQFLRQFLLNQNTPKIADGVRKCKYILGEQSPSSPATLRRYVNYFKTEFHDIWTLEREGQKAWNDKCAPYVDRAWWTLKVGEILVGDGHKLNFQVVNPHTGKPCRASLIMFWDWYSSYPVGWEVMLTENVQCVATALRNSIIVLGKTPDNVYLDNGKAFRAKVFTKNIRLEESEIPGMFARLGINVIWAMKYNAQAKPIERIFGVLEWLDRELPSYSGANINDKPANLLPNEPRAKKLRGDYTPKLAEVNDLIRQWRDFYVVQPLRGRKNQTAQELFDPGRGAGVDHKALCYLMMKAEVKGVRRGRLTFDGYDYAGDCLYGIKPQKVLVRYSLSDRGQIFVFDLQERFLGVVTPVEATAPRDHEAAKRIISERRRLFKHTKTLANLAKSASPETIDAALKREPALIDFIQREEAMRPENRTFTFPHFEEDEPVKSSVRDEPRFNDAWERYELLMQKSEITDEEKSWIQDYETGMIFPGEWASIYGTKAEAL